MPPTKRPRSRKTGRGRHAVGESNDHVALEDIVDSGIIYGASLPINRLNKLVKAEIVTADWENTNGEASHLGQLVINLRSFVKSLGKRRVTKEILGHPQYSTYFRVKFNACWSDFDYGPPIDFMVVGQGALGILDRMHPALDVSLKLEQSIFNSKDYINYRYINKRNAWMCCLYEDIITSLVKGCDSELLANIKDGSLTAELVYRERKVDLRLCLCVGDMIYRLFMLTHIDETTFKRVSLCPSKNNVRIPTTLKCTLNLVEPVPDIDLRPTPTYNCAIMEDLSREYLNSTLVGFFKKYAKMQGALALLKVWARTNGLKSFEVDATTDGSEHEQNGMSNSRKGESVTSADLIPSSIKNDLKRETLSSSVSSVHNDMIHQLCSNPDRETGLYFHNGMSGFIWAILLCHVAKCNEFPDEIEAFPLFLATVKFIGSMDINKFTYVFGKSIPITKGSDGIWNENITNGTGSEGHSGKNLHNLDNARKSQNGADISLPEFFMDKDMPLNVLYKMIFTFQEVIDVAKATLKATSNLSSPFLYNQLFGLHFNPHCHHDVKLIFKRCTDDSSFNIWELESADYLAAKLIFILEFGLQDRLHHAYFRKNLAGDLMVLIGLDDTIQRTTDIGPSVTSEECAFFRRFWHPLSETRSFNDGSISECLLWNVLESKDISLATGSHSLNHISGPNLNLRILNILLQCHFKKFKLVVINKWMASEGTEAMAEKKATENVILMELQLVECGNRIATEYRSKLMNVYNELNEILRSIDSIPLKVSNIYLCDPSFGYADVGEAKLRHKLLLGLESSAKWPDSEKAITGVKVSLGIAILKELYKCHNIKSRISENGDMELQLHGIKFSVSILCQKETHKIISRINNYDPHMDKKPSEDALNNVRDYYRSLQVDRCKVVALKNPSFTSSTQLCKAFCNSCQLPNSEFICEMLNCYIFSSHEFMLPSPHSGNVGFMRFLYLVAHYGWSEHPILLHNGTPLYHMLQMKKPATVPYLWISLPEDAYCIVPKMPSTMLSKRFVGQCQRFLDKIDRHFMKTICFNSFFEVESAGYDVIIEVENLYAKLKFSDRKESVKLSLDEAAYILDAFVVKLRNMYEGILEIAYNELEWRGIQNTAKNLQLYLKFVPLSCIPTNGPNSHGPQQVVIHEERSVFIPNFPAILNGISCLGEGLIRQIRFL
ncbi:hypothetical protein X943_002452 [Babesia divergens]|uniref:Uncharacterized protein n=1 Tax=Babesia divergens TaxID=32595 RepID=A0AAD9GD34_BABDI|nr:hypothetical protein X943_002452 [Babesia divergens]